MLVKPSYLQLARLTTNRDHEDMVKKGDRTLATWIGPGSYHFTTYTGDVANTFKDIEYGQMLDGHWNYVYFGYKRKS